MVKQDSLLLSPHTLTSLNHIRISTQPAPVQQNVSSFTQSSIAFATPQFGATAASMPNSPAAALIGGQNNAMPKSPRIGSTAESFDCHQEGAICGGAFASSHQRWRSTSLLDIGDETALFLQQHQLMFRQQQQQFGTESTTNLSATAAVELTHQQQQQCSTTTTIKGNNNGRNSQSTTPSAGGKMLFDHHQSFSSFLTPTFSGCHHFNAALAKRPLSMINMVGESTGDELESVNKAEKNEQKFGSNVHTNNSEKVGEEQAPNNRNLCDVGTSQPPQIRKKKKPYKELTLEEKVDLIRLAERSANLSQASIADRYSIAKSNVCRILQRKEEYLRAFQHSGFVAGSRKRKLRTLLDDIPTVSEEQRQSFEQQRHQLQQQQQQQSQTAAAENKLKLLLPKVGDQLGLNDIVGTEHGKINADSLAPSTVDKDRSLQNESDKSAVNSTTTTTVKANEVRETQHLEICTVHCEPSTQFSIDRIYQDVDALRSHMTTKHGSSRLLMCRCCNWSFPDKSSLQTHVKSKAIKDGEPMKQEEEAEVEEGVGQRRKFKIRRLPSEEYERCFTHRTNKSEWRFDNNNGGRRPQFASPSRRRTASVDRHRQQRSAAELVHPYPLKAATHYRPLTAAVAIQQQQPSVCCFSVGTTPPRPASLFPPQTSHLTLQRSAAMVPRIHPSSLIGVPAADRILQLTPTQWEKSATAAVPLSTRTLADLNALTTISSLCAAQLPPSCDVVQQHLLQHNNQAATNFIKFEQFQATTERRNLPSLPGETNRSGFLFNLWQKILQQQQQHQCNSHSSDSEGSSTDQHLKPIGAVDSEQQKALELAGDLKFDGETLALMSNERRQAAALQLIANSQRLARKNGAGGDETTNDDDRSGDLEMEEHELASSGDSSHSRSPSGPTTQQPEPATMRNGDRRQQCSNSNSATTSPNSSSGSLQHSGGGVVANESVNDDVNPVVQQHQVRAKQQQQQQQQQIRENCKELENKDRNNNGNGNDVVQVLRAFPPPPSATAECEQCLALTARLSLLLNRLHYLEVCNTGFQSELLRVGTKLAMAEQCVRKLELGAQQCTEKNELLRYKLSACREKALLLIQSPGVAERLPFELTNFIAEILKISVI